MDINTFKGQRFYLLQFNEEFCWEIEEDGFVIIIGETHFEAFKAKVESRKQDENFRFFPRCKLTDLETERATNLHCGYAREYLENAVEKTQEISLDEFVALNKTLGKFGEKGNTSLFHQVTNEYNSDKSKPRHDYMSWGYDLFYFTLMEDE